MDKLSVEPLKTPRLQLVLLVFCMPWIWLVVTIVLIKGNFSFPTSTHKSLAAFSGIPTRLSSLSRLSGPSDIYPKMAAIDVVPLMVAISIPIVSFVVIVLDGTCFEVPEWVTHLPVSISLNILVCFSSFLFLRYFVARSAAFLVSLSLILAIYLVTLP